MSWDDMSRDKMSPDLTCSKAVTIKVGSGSHQERIKLRKGREVIYIEQG